MYKFFAVAASSYMIFARMALAQTTLDTSAVDIQLQISPKYPGPHESVRIEAVSYSFDMRTASFSWHVNQKSAGSGKGMTSITATTGGVGSKTTIKVAGKAPNGKEFTDTITLHPSDIDVLWSASTHVPVGYSGKALPSPESVVTIFAQPFFSIGGNAINPSRLLYTWSLDDVTLTDKSGLGRNTLSVFLAGNSNIENSIKVRVSDDKEQSVREKTITIRARDPHIAFYKLDPLRGPLYQKNITDLGLGAGNEMKIIAVPFFVNTLAPDTLAYTWSVDGNKLPPALVQPNVLKYRAYGGSVADQFISLEVRTGSRRISPTTGSFRIHVQ